jgi:hypothetical protein
LNFSLLFNSVVELRLSSAFFLGLRVIALVRFFLDCLFHLRSLFLFRWISAVFLSLWLRLCNFSCIDKA